MATTWQAAYMAGALDGEGHIGLMRKAPSAEDDRVSPQFTFVIKVTNTNRQWLETLSQWFGGYIYDMNKASETHRASYDLRFRASESRVLLAEVMPYLLMKRRQAELILAYFETSARRRASRVPSEPVPEDIIAEQEAICAEIKSLNLYRKKGQDQTWRRAVARCSITGCERKHRGKGYCFMHYRKYIIRGGPALYERKCESCGRDFVARRSDGVCCSKPCADKQYYRRNSEIIKAHVAENKRKKQVNA